MKNLNYIVLLIIGIINASVSADEYHYKDILIGDRAAGLGGTYVAVSDDPSGMYYNPAGIVYAASQKLSASMNTYNIRKTTYKNALAGKDWVRSSSLLLPNFFGVTQPLGVGTFGISYAIPDSAIEDQDQTIPLDISPNDGNNATTDFTINFNNQDNTYNAGPSFALKISKNLSMGITLYGYTRIQEQIFNQVFEAPLSHNDIAAVEATETIAAVDAVVNTEDVYHMENLYISRKEYGIKPIFGIMYTPYEKISLGITFSNTWMLSNTIVRQEVCASTLRNINTTLCKQGELNRLKTEFEGTREFPWELATGIAYFPSNTLMLTSDIVIYKGINATTKPMFNISAGIEYYLTKTFALRAGGFTNNANTPELIPGVINRYPEHVDLKGGTISLSNFTRSSSLSFGVVLTKGTGEAQVLSGSPNLQVTEILGITAFMSASHSL